MTPLLTTEQAARQLNCSLATLKRRISSGQLPVFRDGRLIRIRQQDLDHYIEQRVCTPAQRRRPNTTAVTKPLMTGRKLFELPDPLT